MDEVNDIIKQFTEDEEPEVLKPGPKSAAPRATRQPLTHRPRGRPPKAPDSKPNSRAGIKSPDDLTVKDVNLVKEVREKNLEAVRLQVNRWAGMAQISFIANGDMYCAKAIGDHVPQIATSLAVISEDFPLVKQLIEASDRWGAAAVLVWSVAQLGLTIGVHHEMVPYSGVIKFMVPMPPKKLEEMPPEMAAQIVNFQNANKPPIQAG